jgi:hypothetical protein
MPATKHEHEREPNWIIALRRTPAGPGKSQPEDPGADTFEIICRECGDDPALDYQEVSAELQQIRGPYTFSAGSAVFGKHAESHPGTDEM